MAMDAAALQQRIRATLVADANVRRQAEIDLKHAEDNPDFILALVGVLQAETDNASQQATVVYLKNRITHAWNPSDDYPQNKRIPDEQKELFRQRLPSLLSTSPANVRTHLVTCLQTILHKDFPTNWPTIYDTTVQLLGAQGAGSVFAGLQCILGICRVYRFKTGENRGVFDKIVSMCFPQLLAMGNKLVEETSIEAGELLRAIVKAYKHAIYFELPAYCQQHQATVDWCTLFIRIVAKDPPPCSLLPDVDERESNHWWKAKKWAYANLNRLFVRYGNPATMSKGNGDEYKAFSESFLNNFAPEILKAYLQQVEKWVTKTTWLSKAALSAIITFLDECVKPKVMWAHLKPHTENLIAHFIFPCLCQSDDDLELFSTDPPEYLHRKLNYYEQVSAPDVAAINFLIALTKSRKKETFSILSFINGIVNRYESAPEGQKDAREKEGALRMVGTLASVILGKKSPIADQVEMFVVRYVFPEFNSPHGFLRARACDTMEKFEALEFKDPNNLLVSYNSILKAMGDSELPVRVEAALALQPLIRHDAIRESLKANIPQIMQQLLKLANEVDVDALANVMEDFVEVFSEQLTPFAVALTEQLRDTYLRIVRELLEKGETNEDDEGLGLLDDKSVTALGVLQTIGTLILTLESTPDVLLKLEEILMPLISVTLDNKIYDLYTEIFEIVDSCTFASKSISPIMWRAFELMHKTFRAGAELYIEDMQPALENFIQFGAPHMVQNPAYVEAIADMVREIFGGKHEGGGMEKISACKLAEACMLSLRGHVDDYASEFVRLAMKDMTNGESKVKSYRIHLIEVVINAVYYNPALALGVLEAGGLTNKFFSYWFANIDHMSRVHDKKLSIAAITSLLAIPPQQVPQSVQQGWPRLLHGLVKLFQTLPAAVERREEAKKEDEEFQLNDEYGLSDDEDEWGDEADWADDSGEAGDVEDESSAYLEFLDEEAKKLGAALDPDDDDDELDEESLLETLLDEVEPYTLLKLSLMNLQAEQPQYYANLMKELGPEEQKVLQEAVSRADAEALKLQQQRQAAAAAAANGASS